MPSLNYILQRPTEDIELEIQYTILGPEPEVGIYWHSNQIEKILSKVNGQWTQMNLSDEEFEKVCDWVESQGE